MNGRRLQKGVTFTELLVSISFLGICASISVDATTELTASIARAERYEAAFVLATNAVSTAVAPHYDASVSTHYVNSTNFFPIGGGTTAMVVVAVNGTGFPGVSHYYIEVSYPERRRGQVVTESIKFLGYVRKR